MDRRENQERLEDPARRGFLQTVGASVPTLALLVQGDSFEAHASEPRSAETVSPKFTPIDLAQYFNASPREFGPRKKAKEIGGDSTRDGVVRVPTGKQIFQGIPFWLGVEGVGSKSWIGLSTTPSSWSQRSVEIPLATKANFVCLATFCDWDENEEPPAGEDVAEKVGQHLAHAELIYEDGGKTNLPVRRRFEVNSPRIVWGHLCFNALPDSKWGPAELTKPLSNAMDWGPLQTSLLDGLHAYPTSPGLGTLWICALSNPEPERVLKVLRVEAASNDPLLVCGLTLFHGTVSPLRQERLSLYRLTLPDPSAQEKGRWVVNVDLGIVARTFALPNFDPQTWLAAPVVGLGEQPQPPKDSRDLYVELAANPEATLVLSDTKTGHRYEFNLDQPAPGREIEGSPPGVRAEVLEREKCWLYGQVVDAATRRPTPVRLSFHSPNGRYLPPYGHATEINPGWFQDYGADLQLGEASFAYVDGTFQVELPVGEVYVEMTKGFEYEAVRKKLNIRPGQRELKLEIPRMEDLRSRGWVTADTHVHFLSPPTAILEGQAEGVNLINLLASQWGDLFTNVGDLSAGPVTSRDGETLVWVGTENRQHILGHIGLLGGKGPPVYPMCTSGPSESYLGDPAWSTMAEWADACRQREGLAVAVHFAYPTSEIAADIVLGKIDAVEVRPDFSEHFNSLYILDWYRYLNCGYRLPVVGGTDKMSGRMPVGGERTYAYLGQEPFSFASWAKAVRRGNTFMTSGPLLLFQADGHTPGDEITINSGGATVEVQVEAKSVVPFHYLQVILNGRVVASREDTGGTRELTIKEKVYVAGPGWLAARCSSRLRNETGQWPLRVCAHTSPVYFRVPEQELFSPPAASYMLALIEGSLTWVENVATRPDSERYERMRKIFLDARERLHRRLHEHGIEH
jgi:hypothetical protein